MTQAEYPWPLGTLRRLHQETHMDKSDDLQAMIMESDLPIALRGALGAIAQRGRTVRELATELGCTLKLAGEHLVALRRRGLIEIVSGSKADAVYGLDPLMLTRLGKARVAEHWSPT